MNKTSWILTYTGRKVYPLELTPDQVCVEDIAHALSLKCRFTGHCRTFYSVADHSVRVAALLPLGKQIHGLLHDAAEAYLPDVAGPIKGEFCFRPGVPFESRRRPGDAVAAGPHLTYHAPFVEVERRVLWAIGKAFAVPLWEEPDAVRHADLILLATEARDLMGEPPEPWALDVPVLPGPIEPLYPADAEQRFLADFARLTAPPAA